jgi:NitT/TauT family transport system substrate-binding protein
MGIQPWLGYGAWYIAQDKGYFTDNGVAVELKDFEADADINAALASKNLDVANVASHTALQFVENGVDVKIVLLLDASTSADAIISAGQVSSVADLRGQQIAYEEGTTSDLLLNYALAGEGMTIADVQKVPMGAAEAGAALIAGQVPVAVTYEPYITEAKEQNPAVTSIFEAGAKEGLISDVLVVRSEVLEQRRGDVEKLVKAWGASLDYYNADPTDGRAIIARGVGEEPDALTTAFDGVHFFDLAANKQELSGGYAESTLPAVKDAATAAGLLTGDVDIASVIDASFVK